jgi:protein-tyrosine-phosphatase
MKVLFLCPHNAAKSVIAAALLKQAAQQQGLSIEVDSAGTEPSAQVMPAVLDLLLRKGIDVSAHSPRSVTAIDLESADRIISLGCTLEELQQITLAIAVPVELWDVPPPSQNLEGAYSAITDKINQLLRELQSHE